jgi:type IV pilus assembly protein PilP
MNKYFVFIRNIVCIVSFFPLLWSCEKPPDPTPKSRQITKKIVLEKKELSKETVKPKPVGIVSDISKSTVPIPESNKKLVAVESPAASFYSPEGKLDPFEPLFKKERVSVAVGKKKIKRRKPLTPLERVNLSQLSLVGIIRAPSGNRALVQETSGKGYVVKKGTYIGTQSGKIVQILEDRIIVEEESEDIYGKVSLIKKPLKLQKPPGE